VCEGGREATVSPRPATPWPGLGTGVWGTGACGGGGFRDDGGGHAVYGTARREAAGEGVTFA